VLEGDDAGEARETEHDDAAHRHGLPGRTRQVRRGRAGFVPPICN
jgi:hypothetical protein